MSSSLSNLLRIKNHPTIEVNGSSSPSSSSPSAPPSPASLPSTSSTSSTSLPPRSPTSSPSHFNMSRARKFIGGLLKKRHHQPGGGSSGIRTNSSPGSPGGGEPQLGNSTSSRRHSDPSSFRSLSFMSVGRFGSRKGSSASTNSSIGGNTSSTSSSKEPSPPPSACRGITATNGVSSPPPTPPASSANNGNSSSNNSSSGGGSRYKLHAPWSNSNSGGSSRSRGHHHHHHHHGSALRPLTVMERRGVKAMLQLAAEADRRHEQRAHLQKTVLLMLDQLDVDVDVTAFVDNTQRLHLMQWSVINGWHEVLVALLERGHSPNMDNENCNGPLHLAAKLGDVHAAELLMQYGASIDTKSTACYPSNSLHLMHNSPFGPSAYCYVHFNSTPLQIALAHDNVHVVKLLMEHTAWPSPEKQALVLHQACRCQADSCVEYLINTMPSSLNVRDPQTGETPLCIALDVGESIVRTILQSGAVLEPEVLRNCNKKGDCVLHKLYATECCPNILALTLMLQESCSSGSVDLVHCQDRTWNTPLHMLCSRMTRLGRRSEYNLEHLPDIYLCTQYLVSRCNDPNVVNRRGESVLHMLFSGCWISFQHQFRYLEPFLVETKKMLALLLSCGVDPDISSPETSTVINTVINCCCGLDPEKAAKIGHHLVEIIEMLVAHKADLNTPDEKGIYMLTRILTACSRWLLNCVGNPSDPPASMVFSFIVGILKTLFGGGMSPPENILRISIKQLAIITISPFDRSGFSADIRTLMGLIFCSGLNPNTLKVMCDRATVDEVKTDDLRYCIARGFVTHREHDGMFTFFAIFHEVLTQPNLNAFSAMICALLETIFQESFFKNVGQCAEQLRQSTLKPRSLSALCRIAINDALDWRVMQKRHRLPLPSPLKLYLSEFS